MYIRLPKKSKFCLPLDFLKHFNLELGYFNILITILSHFVAPCCALAPWLRTTGLFLDLFVIVIVVFNCINHHVETPKMLLHCTLILVQLTEIKMCAECHDKGNTALMRLQKKKTHFLLPC